MAFRAMAPEQPDRIALFSQTLSLFSRRTRPTLVLIEDIHWADDATLDFIRFLARRVRDHGILLILTSREEEDEGRPQTRRALSGVPRDDVARLALDPLSPAAIRDMSGLSEAEAQRIHALSGGSAFFVSELLSGAPSTSLTNVQDAVLSRADRLVPAERPILDTASIFPRRAERRLVLALAPCADAETALHRACCRKTTGSSPSGTRWPAARSKPPCPRPQGET
ncbi:MAG: hypothetical protein LJE68_13725 [Rhodobacter sp.]|nr:hypothetical protein [Rhodobacter sp.]